MLLVLICQRFPLIGITHYGLFDESGSVSKHRSSNVLIKVYIDFLYRSRLVFLIVVITPILNMLVFNLRLLVLNTLTPLSKVVCFRYWSVKLLSILEWRVRYVFVLSGEEVFRCVFELTFLIRSSLKLTGAHHCCMLVKCKLSL